MRQIDIQDLNLGQEVWTPEHGQAAADQIRQQIQAADLNTTKLAEIGEWAERVIQDPSQFPAFQAWLREQGLPESEIPQEPDFQELSSMAAMGRASRDIDQSTEQSQAPTTGPISPEQLAGMGRQGDTMLAHITPEEAAMLESQGGAGTINPATGLPEYNIFSDLWKGIKKVAKAVAPIALPAIAIFAPALIPAVGTALGASAALAPVVGAAAIAGGVTALSGGSVKDILTSAALTGLGAYLTPIVGDYVGNIVGVTDAGIKSVIGSATLAGGMTALRGGTVSQILTAAATGATANYLGQVAGNIVNSGKITNTRITQQPFDDAVFLAADAEQLAAQGLGKNQISEVLRNTGAIPQAADAAAALAATGGNAEDIATKLANTYGANKTLYTNGKTGVENSVVGGGNVTALENVQMAEDAMFVAQDAKNLRAEGLNQAQVRDTLVRSGVDPRLADVAVSETFRGATLDAASQSLVYAADRYQVPMFDSTTATRAIGGGDINQQPAAPVEPVAPEYTAPDSIDEALTAAPPATTMPVNEPTLPTVNVVADAEPGFGDFVPQPQPGGNISEAQFIADDAAQLAATLGNNPTAIEQNLVYSGVDPNVAAAVAQMASLGIPANTISQYLQGEANLYTPPAAPTLPESTQPDLGTGIKTNNLPLPAEGDYSLVGETPTPPGLEPGDLGSGITQPTYPSIPEMGGGTGITIPGVTPEAPPLLQPDLNPPLTDAETGAIVATPVVSDAATPPPLPTGARYNFTPAPPDPRWSQPLQYPGINPGLVGAAIQPAYQTTSPVQAQYYWGRQPYFAYNEDLANYNQVAMPQQPWGIQQGFFERPVDYSQIQPFGPNMFVSQPVAPQTLQAASYQPQAQIMVQPVVPQNLPQVQAFSGPYAYDISAQPGQYTQVA